MHAWMRAHIFSFTAASHTTMLRSHVSLSLSLSSAPISFPSTHKEKHQSKSREESFPISPRFFAFQIEKKKALRRTKETKEEKKRHAETPFDQKIAKADILLLSGAGCWVSMPNATAGSACDIYAMQTFEKAKQRPEVKKKKGRFVCRSLVYSFPVISSSLSR